MKCSPSTPLLLNRTPSPFSRRLPVHHRGGRHGLCDQIQVGRRESVDLQRRGLLEPLQPTPVPGQPNLMKRLEKGKGIGNNGDCFFY
jgi:hypothetical protein